MFGPPARSRYDGPAMSVPVDTNSAYASSSAKPSSEEAVAILRRDGQAIDTFLIDEFLAGHLSVPPRLLEAITYSVSAGGKRLRPTLVLEAFAACDATPDQSASPRYKSALAAAGAMELIHTFSLVHDDLPAMDDDDLRRGQPTNHKVYGEAMAILAGDAMVTLAFELIATQAEPQLVAPLVRELSIAAGPDGMIGGQVLDIDGEHRSLDVDELRQVHARKTGALLTSSCRLGAIAAHANDAQLRAVTEYGRHVGLAFQIVDDILDVTSTPEQLGKATNKDVDRGKNTYPSLLGLDRSRDEAKRQLQAGLAAIAPLGPNAEPLRVLARFVVERNV